MNKLNRVLLILVAGLLFSMPSMGGWVNDWVTQKISGGAGYYDLQGQAIVSFGSLSARWNRGRGPTPLFSFSRPKIAAGCGGIDAKFGGFWFAGVNALVQKIQAIIQNAPAIMFKMALASVSEMLDKASENVEEAVRGLNTLSMDECQATEKLVAMTGLDSAINERVMSLLTKFNIANKSTEKGVTSSGSKAQDDMEKTDTAPATEENLTKPDCPADIQQLLPVSGTVSLLKTASNKLQLGAYEEVMRGMIGDIIISKNTNKGGDTYEAIMLNSCYENKTLTFDNLVFGDLKRMDVNGNCVDDDAAGMGLRDWTVQMLQGIAAAYKSGSTPTKEQINFMDTVPLMIDHRIRTAVMSNAENVMINEMADLIATAYAYYSIEDMYRAIRKTANIFKNEATKDHSRIAECKIAAVGQMINMLDKWSKDSYKMTMAMRRYYILRINEYNATRNYSKDVLEQRQGVEQLIKRRATDQVQKIESSGN